jgi:TolA-binding protein
MIDVITAGPAAPASSYLPYIVGIMVALLGGGGLAALLKTGREGSKIVVDAAAGAVVIQSGVMTDLRKQLDDAQAQITAMRGQLTDLTSFREENRQLRGRQAQLEQENTALSLRVTELERA